MIGDADNQGTELMARSQTTNAGCARSAIHALCMLLALLPCTQAAQAAQRVLLYGDENYPPYSYIANQRFTGIDVDILRMAAAKLAPAYDIKLLPTPWKRGLAMLEAGAAFGLFPPGLKRDRHYIDRYSTVILRESVVVFCNRAVMQSPRSHFPDDFAGLTIGINAGFLLSDRLMQAANRGIVKLEPAKDNNANLRKLALHRIDCYASDRVAALYSARQLADELSAQERLPQVAAALSDENTYIGYSARNAPAYKADFIEKMDAVLNAMKANGDIDRIIERYLKGP
ncbi:MAG: transporter substrate-binding domain-containing protein [Pseudomonadota bacterium]|nr:transporter substrate-binding domain-containing protein [Pseudomonadota bacterium]